MCLGCNRQHANRAAGCIIAISPLRAVSRLSGAPFSLNEPRVKSCYREMSIVPASAFLSYRAGVVGIEARDNVVLAGR